MVFQGGQIPHAPPLGTSAGIMASLCVAVLVPNRLETLFEHISSELYGNDVFNTAVENALEKMKVKEEN